MEVTNLQHCLLRGHVPEQWVQLVPVDLANGETVIMLTLSLHRHRNAKRRLKPERGAAQ